MDSSSPPTPPPRPTPPPPPPPKPLSPLFTTARYTPHWRLKTQLLDATVLAKTSDGHYAKFDVIAGENLYLPRLEVYRRDGSLVLARRGLLIRAPFHADLDAAREAREGSDFFWRGPYQGVGHLVPQNGAQFAVALDFWAIKRIDAASAPVRSGALPETDLADTTLLARSDRGLYAKLTVRATPVHLLIPRLVTWGPDGREAVNLRDRPLAPGQSLDLDTGSIRAAGGDLSWQGPRAGQRRLSTVGTAAMALFRKL